MQQYFWDGFEKRASKIIEMENVGGKFVHPASEKVEKVMQGVNKLKALGGAALIGGAGYLAHKAIKGKKDE